jgi:hypothetical protein
MYVYACMHIYVCICMYAHICMYMHVCTSVLTEPEQQHPYAWLKSVTVSDEVAAVSVCASSPAVTLPLQHRLPASCSAPVLRAASDIRDAVHRHVKAVTGKCYALICCCDQLGTSS